jgi:hypothetical protein
MEQDHNVIRTCLMIRNAKDVSPDQKMAIEGLLGLCVAAVNPAPQRRPKKSSPRP